jgi:hypothetical protein
MCGYIVKLKSDYLKSGVGKVRYLYAKVDHISISSFINLYVNSK